MAGDAVSRCRRATPGTDPVRHDCRVRRRQAAGRARLRPCRRKPRPQDAAEADRRGELRGEPRPHPGDRLLRPDAVHLQRAVERTVHGGDGRGCIEGVTHAADG